MQVEDVFAEGECLVGVVPDQVVNGVNLGVAGHHNAAGSHPELVIDRHVGFLAHAFEDAEQRGGFVGIGVFAVAGEVPFDKVVVRLAAEETPGDDAAGVDEVLDEVVRLGDGVAFEGRTRQIVEAFKTATLQQFGQAALDGDFHARVGAKRGENAAGAWIHQGHAHHRKLAAQRGVLDQHREALVLQLLDAGDDAGIFRQHLGRHIGQRDFAFDDLAFDGALEDFRQALHLRFRQGVAGAHAIAEVEVVDQVGREIHGFAVRLTHVGQGADAAFGVAGVGVEQMRGAQLAVRVVDFQRVFVEQTLGQRILLARLEPALFRVMHKGRVGDFRAPVNVVVEMVAVQALDVFAQCRGQRALLGRTFAVGEAHR